MDQLILIDTLLRGMALGIMLAASLVLALRQRSRMRAAAPAALGITGGCYAIMTGLGAQTIPDAAVPLLCFGAACVPAALTWLILCIFLDDPGDRRPWFGVAAATIPVSLLAVDWPAAETVRAAMVLTLCLGLIGVTLRTAQDDLLECRRAARPGIALAMGGLGAVTTAMELWVGQDAVPVSFTLATGAALAVLALAFALWSLGPHGDLWAGQPADRDPHATASDAPAAMSGLAEGHRSAPGQSPEAAAEDTRIARALAGAMDHGAWAREGLTIGALAADLGVAEHKLRRVINQRLGYRNFSTFVNGYRVAAARKALADPERAGEAVLEIAFASGFASLGPFNKAFRAMVGQSPREYRRAALAGGPACASTAEGSEPKSTG
ncbi:MAG: helix-turn-helix domain-containing protein [Pseudomonadota bacterium]